MKTLLRKLVAAIARFISGSKKSDASTHSATMKVVHRKAESTLYKGIRVLVKEHPDFPACRKDSRLLHRRLAEYQRCGWNGGAQKKDIALRRLEKQWKKTLRNRMRLVKGDRGEQGAVGRGSKQ